LPSGLSEDKFLGRGRAVDVSVTLESEEEWSFRMKSIHIVEEYLPLAWEKAVLACWEQGETFPTEYDKPGDLPSRDVTCLIHVTKPFEDPRIHRAFPGGLDDLEKYRAEVVYGVHDHWIDPSVGKWEYTYHERLCDYRLPDGTVYDQIEGVIEKLKSAGHTRRAQAVTWQVWNDMNVDDPTCLQRMWFRISGKDKRLHLNVHMRSNDAFKAAFMNMFAFSELQGQVAELEGELALGRAHAGERVARRVPGGIRGEEEPAKCVRARR